MRIPLNPCDFLYFVHHRHIHRSGTGGGVGFLIVEAAGTVNPDKTLAAFIAAMRAHPAVLSHVRIGRILGRPFWAAPRNLEQAACQAARRAFIYLDLRESPDSEGRLRALLSDHFTPDWGLSPTPQVQLEQYDLPGERTWFCLRWPHFLMDAGGGQWFLSEIGRLSATEAPAPPEQLASDDESIDPLAGVSYLSRWRLIKSGFSLHKDFAGLKVAPLVPSPPPRVVSQGLLWRTWPADMVRQMRRNADEFAPPGPASHARYLGSCVIRALHSIYTERKINVDAYAISLPLSMTGGDSDEEESGTSRRPMPGNYLVAPTLYGRRELVDDRVALGRDLLKQLESYYAKKGPQAQWAMIWIASKMRVWMYDMMYRRRIGVDPLSCGFSYYGPIPRQVRRICGAKVTNIWGTAPLDTPPGMNPIFNKHQGKLNLGLAYNRPAISDELASQFVSLVEREIFE